VPGTGHPERLAALGLLALSRDTCDNRVSRERGPPSFDRFGAWAGRRPCAGLGTGLLSRTRVVRSGGSTRVAARDLHDSDRGASVPPPRSRSDCTRGNGVGLSRSWVRCGLSPSPLWWRGPAQYGGGDRTCPVAVDSVEDVEKTCPCPTGRATQQWPLVSESRGSVQPPTAHADIGAAGRLRWADPPNAAIREPAHGERTCPWPQRGPGGAMRRRGPRQAGSSRSQKRDARDRLLRRYAKVTWP
jgi:hypothetical protein